MTYKEQLASPKWQKKRLEIFERDKFTCQICFDTESQLHVHHNYYDKSYQTLAWDYPSNCYKTLCLDCHEALTIHIEEYGNDKEFNVLRIKDKDGVVTNDSLYIYSKGTLKFKIKNVDLDINITENTTYKIVQFLINNWLKNG